MNIRTARSFACAFAILVAGNSPTYACENDGIPGYNHATGQIDVDPYAGAYTEVAEKVASDQRAAAIERARSAFVQRFGLDDADSAAAPTAVVAVAMTAPDVRPN
jgi:hypothetical protein